MSTLYRVYDSPEYVQCRNDEIFTAIGINRANMFFLGLAVSPHREITLLPGSRSLTSWTSTDRIWSVAGRTHVAQAEPTLHAGDRDGPHGLSRKSQTDEAVQAIEDRLR